jgi:sporulation protein YlmC with PRC-barrel domain
MGRTTRGAVKRDGVSRPSDAPTSFKNPRRERHIMADILAENLSGKAVMGTDGVELGMLYNITMNMKTGALRNLLVEPDENTPPNVGFDQDDSGRYQVPVGHVQAVKDYIVVER